MYIKLIIVNHTYNFQHERSIYIRVQYIQLQACIANVIAHVQCKVQCTSRYSLTDCLPFHTLVFAALQ